MAKLSPQDIRISIAEDGGRLLLSMAGPAFLDVLSDYKARFMPGRLAVWRPEDKRWSMPLSAAVRQRLEAWLSQTCEPECVQWATEAGEEHATGSQTRSSGRSSYARYHGRRHRHQRDDDRRVALTLQEAYERLGLVPHVPQGLAECAYKWWCKQLHPDVGGSDQGMVDLNEAISIIRKQAS